MSLTQERVKELFDYHEDGHLIWKETRSVIKKGDIAGYKSKSGYIQVGIDSKLYYVHRIIFLWHHGYIPENGVDHDDRVKDHNWIDNLFEASKQCNARNSKIGKNNKSGVTGVYYSKDKDKWVSGIKVNGKTIHLGCYDNFDDAVKARYQGEVEINWNGCNSTSSAYLYLKDKNLVLRKIRFRGKFRRNNVATSVT